MKKEKKASWPLDFPLSFTGIVEILHSEEDLATYASLYENLDLVLHYKFITGIKLAKSFGLWILTQRKLL